jgi:hypothetical protein
MLTGDEMKLIEEAALLAREDKSVWARALVLKAAERLVAKGRADETRRAGEV